MFICFPINLRVISEQEGMVSSTCRETKCVSEGWCRLPHQDTRMAHPHTDHYSFLPIHARRTSEAELRSSSSPSWTLEKMRTAPLAVLVQLLEILHDTTWGISPKAQLGYQQKKILEPSGSPNRSDVMRQSPGLRTICPMRGTTRISLQSHPSERANAMGQKFSFSSSLFSTNLRSRVSAGGEGLAE